MSSNGQLNGDIAEYPSTEASSSPYHVLDQYHSKRPRIRIASVGAGASGLCLAYKAERILKPGTWDLVLYEKNPHLGGTWWENTYPGVACDIPSHLYTFSFDPKPDWSQFFASGAEIQKYFENFADRYNTHRYIKLSSKVVEARWDEEKGIWQITIEDQTTKQTSQDWAHILINGTGILNTWKWPDIEGLHSFGGPLMHSANWNHDVDFVNQKVGVIGVGSTSIQIVPQLQKVVAKLSVFIRSPTYISPPFGAGVLQSELATGADDNPGQRQYDFTADDVKKFKQDPNYHLQFRKKIEAEINTLFGMYIEDSELSNRFRDTITKEMNRRIGPGHQQLKDFIIPKWAPGCRRITPGDGYLEALVQPNVEPVFSNVERVTPSGIVTADGREHDLDILVCATGFSPAFKPAFRVVNASGKTIQEDWGDKVNMYMGISTPHFPNFFTIVGPGATWSNGTLLPGIETTIEYILTITDKMQAEQIKAIEIKQEAVDDLYAHFDEYHKKTVWKQECRSWFKDGKQEGRIYLWPGSTIHFLKSIKDPRYEDYLIRPRFGNRFAYLGNGDVKATKSGDVEALSTYIRASDHPWSVE